MCFIEPDPPYYDRELRSCKNCGEPILNGFIHVCGILYNIDKTSESKIVDGDGDGDDENE